MTRSHNVHIRQCKVCAFQTGRHIASACRSETCPLQPSFRLGGSQRPGLAESCSFSRHNCVHHTMPLYLARPCEPMISICGRILCHRRQFGRVRSHGCQDIRSDVVWATSTSGGIWSVSPPAKPHTCLYCTRMVSTSAHMTKYIDRYITVRVACWDALEYQAHHSSPTLPLVCCCCFCFCFCGSAVVACCDALE